VARRALARAKTIQAAKHISDIAEAIRTYTERSGMAKEAQDDAASFAIEAEYRVSKLYKAAKDQGLLATGSRGQLKGRKSSGGVVITPPEKQPTLAEVDISKELAKRLRKLAPLSEEELVKRIEQKRAAHELTKTAVLGDPVKKRVRTPTRQDCLKTLFKLIEVLANSADEPYDDVFLSGQKLDIGKYHAVRPKFIKFINCVDAFIKAQPAAASPTGEERKPQESV
jgi:hypothetical protein